MPTFTKSERLCSKLLIDEVMTKGSSFNCQPFRVSWKLRPDLAAPVQVMISVPKKIHKRAVDRNRMKRIIREAYRNHKDELYAGLQDKNLMLVLIYTAKVLGTYQETEKRILDVISRLKDQVNK